MTFYCWMQLDTSRAAVDFVLFASLCTLLYLPCSYPNSLTTIRCDAEIFCFHIVCYNVRRLLCTPMTVTALSKMYL